MSERLARERHRWKGKTER